MLNMSAIKMDKRKQLLADARRATVVTCDMVRRSFALGLPDSLVWAAAGAGLADYHKRTGIAVDLRAELKGEKVPKAYFEGYDSEMYAGTLAAELNRAMGA